MRTTAVAIALTFLTTHALAAEGSKDLAELEPLEVNATLRAESMEEIPASVSIFDSNQLTEAGARHFEDIIGLTPNLNYSGGTSRPRFLQIRGIGELDQYDEPVIPSVGFIIDDIDFSGIGGSADLFDIEQVEVLRGPQGSIFGANAMAGLVNLKSTEPSEHPRGRLMLEYGSYDKRALGLALGGPLSRGDEKPLTYRFSIHSNRSDGYMENEALDRNDTDNIDELTGRMKLRWRPSDDFTLDLTGTYLDFDNGYDAFSFTDDFKTRTNDPGYDTQETSAASARASWTGAAAFELLSITAGGDSDSDYRFDADWGAANDFERYQRERKFISQEFRVSSKPAGRILDGSTDWIVGVYAKQKDEHAQEEQSYSGFELASANDYRADVYALYSQIEHHLSPRATLVLAGRGEGRDVDYDDSYGARFNPRDEMYGGNLSLQYELDERHWAYATLARGYKGSGFNPDPATPEDIRVYEKEHLWNCEIGLRSDLEWLRTDLDIFYTRRSNPQIKWWDPGPPWVPYTINGEKGYSYGAEAGVDIYPYQSIRFFANLGLLHSRIYSDKIAVLADGREDPHAPSYQFATGAELRLPAGYAARVEMLGSDGFQFDYYYNAESDPYRVVNARIGYEADRWTFYLWGRNIFDENYALRGLNLGDIYTQKGWPANYGATLNYYF